MRPGKFIKRTLFLGLAGGVVLWATVGMAGGATAPTLGTAEPFAVLAGTTVTNTGLTTISGDLGVDPGSAIADSGTIVLTGATHTSDAVSLQAQNDVITAYNALGAEPCTDSFAGTAVEIGGQTLVPGVYCYSSSALLTGTLVLNGDGIYIFKMGSTLTTASASVVSLIGGAQPCNVFWQIGSSADLFSTTTFVGNILALTSINLQTGATLQGRALARNGAVTLDTNTITAPSCALALTPTATVTATSTPLPGATATATAVAATPTTTPGPGTPTATPGPGTPTVTPGPGTPTVTPGPRTPVPTIGTPTSVPGAPPASPLETPETGSPQAPGLPNAGSGARGHRTMPFALPLVALVAGGLALGSGLARYRRSVR